MNKVFYVIIICLAHELFADSSKYLLEGVAPQVRLEVDLEARPGQLTINSDRIYLGDLFECFASDRVCEKIRGVDLGAAPKPKRLFRLSGEDIKQYIEDDLKSSYKLSISVPKVIQVKAAYQQLDDSQIEKELQTNFNTLVLDGYKYELKGFSFSRGNLLYPGEIDLDFIGLKEDVEKLLKNSDKNYPNLKANLKLTSISSGAKINSFLPIRLFFKKFEKAIFLSRNKKKGELIKESDLYSSWIASTSRSSVENMNDVLGRVARRNLAEASPIYSSDFEKPKLIKKREEINAIMADSGLQLQTKAIALEDGGLGDKISIKLMSTNKKLNARIVSAKSVKVIR